MKIFVTGATGFIGIQLVKRLVSQGNTVHALYRNESKASLVRGDGVVLFKGDILQKESLSAAMLGCNQAYHVAAFAGVWSKDPGMVQRLNVEGALNVIDAAGAAGIKRVVVTSTAGILGPSDQVALNEESPPPSSFFTEYEKSKFILEQRLMALKINIPEVVIVNPTRVYGPGFLSESNGVTRMIKKYMEGRWRFVPGNGNRSGNYVYIEDVVTGHMLAMEKGIPGQRYILGGDNITYNQLFQFTAEASGIHKKLFKLPLGLMLAAAVFMKGISMITNRPPMIVPDLVRKFNHHWIVSSDKAINTLGYEPLAASEGIRRTVHWILSNHKHQTDD